MGSEHVSIAAKKDLELERKLSKKLKVKEGKLRGLDDGLNIILDGMSSAFDFMGEGGVLGTGELSTKRLKKSSSTKKDKFSKKRMKVEAMDDILRDSIRHPSKKLLSFEFAQSFGIQFRASRYITGLNQTSE